MSDKFVVEIITPDQSILKTETNEVTIPSFEGEMGILKDHIPLITFLRPGIVEVNNEKKNETFFLDEGIVEFSNDTLLILSSSIKNIKDLTKKEIDEQLSLAEKSFNEEKCSDKEKYILSYKIEGLKNLSL